MSSAASVRLRETRDQKDARAADTAEAPERRRKLPRGIVGGAQIFSILAVVAVAVAFSREGPAPSAVLASAPKAPAPANQAVNVVMPELKTSQVTIQATGTVMVRNHVGLVPEVSGRVVSLARSLRSGGHFEAGEELLRIDPSEFRLALEQAKADLAIAQSRLRLQQAESAAARKNYALVHPDKPVPDLVAKVPQVEQRQAEVAAAQARVDRATLDLSRTRFFLPFAGRISASTAEIGQMLNKGQPFGEAFALDALEVVVPLAEEDVARLAPVEGRSARVVAGAVTLDAVVERISAELDQRTRFAKVFLALSDVGTLRPGTFATVTLLGPMQAGTYVLPEAAEQINGSFWVVDQGALRRVSPRIIQRTAQGVVVEGFDAGDGVVLGAVPGAREGLAVRAEITSS